MGKKRKRMQRYLDFQKKGKTPAPPAAPAARPQVVKTPVATPAPKPVPAPEPIEKKPEPQPVVESAVVESAPAEHAEELVSPIPSKPAVEPKPRRRRSYKKESKEE